MDDCPTALRISSASPRWAWREGGEASAARGKRKQADEGDAMEADQQFQHPETPCMAYLPTLAPETTPSTPMDANMPFMECVLTCLFKLRVQRISLIHPTAMELAFLHGWLISRVNVGIVQSNGVSLGMFIYTQITQCRTVYFSQDMSG